MAPRLGKWVTFVRSLGLGAAAYAIGYLLTLVWLGDGTDSIAGDVLVTVRASSAEAAFTREVTLATHLDLFDVSVSTWSGWLFYNAHFVPLSLSFRGRGVHGTVPNILLDADPPFLVVLFFVPPLLLVAAGAISVVMRGLPPMGGLLPAGVAPGMAVTAGYLPLAVAGAYLFAIREPMDYSGIAPSLLWSVLVMGLVYPLLFGGFGGWMVTRVRGSSSSDHTPSSDYSPR